MYNGEIKLRRAEISDAREMHRVMEAARDSLEDKTVYFCDELDYVEAHIADRGFGIVACSADNEIAGCMLIRFPGSDSDNLGLDIGLDNSELNRVAHIESVAVLPEYRGLGLQRRMLEFTEVIIDRDRYDILLATVSPDNPSSFISMERSGYTHVLTKKKYGGCDRRIYIKRL